MTLLKIYFYFLYPHHKYITYVNLITLGFIYFFPVFQSHKLSGTNLDVEDVEAAKEKGGGGLRSRGLCLVPVSTTLHVAKDNTTDFWAPTFGGSFR